jgi:hypothetical protein
MRGLRIAFGYKARSGKDTAAEYLQKQYGGEIFKFAQPIYDIMKAAHKIAGIDTFKDTKMLTWVGTDWGRSINKDLWVNNCLDRINAAQRRGCYMSGEPFVNNFFVTDMRFPNEAEALKNNGFVLVRIDRNNRPVENRANHESENAMNDFKDWDIVINNDSQLKEFYEQLEKLVQHINNTKKYIIK